MVTNQGLYTIFGENLGVSTPSEIEKYLKHRFQNKAGGYTAGLPNFLAKVSLYFFLKFKTLKRNQLFLKLIFKTFNYYEDIKL